MRTSADESEIDLSFHKRMTEFGKRRRLWSHGIFFANFHQLFFCFLFFNAKKKW